MVHHWWAVLVALVQWVAAIAVLVACYRLQHLPKSGVGSYEWYAVALIGSVALVLLRRRKPSSVAAPALLHWMVAAVLVAVAIGGSVWMCTPGFLPSPYGPWQLAIWGGMGLAMIAAGHVVDARPGSSVAPVEFDRCDGVAAVGLFLAATLARVWEIGTWVPGLAYDEAHPLAMTLSTPRRTLSMFFVNTMSMPMMFHEVMRGAIDGLAWLGMDTVRTAKIGNALLASVSVPVFFLAVRTLVGRGVAFAAGCFLVLQNWHWLYSRFYYLYAGDLLWVAGATLAIFVGLRTRRIAWIAAAGVISAIGFAWLKTALIVAPWVVLVIGEYVLTGYRERWRMGVVAMLTVIATFTVLMAPAALQYRTRSTTLLRMESVVRDGQATMDRREMAPLERWQRGLYAPLRTLQVHYGNWGRYSLRNPYPLFDAVSSALFIIGIIWCVLLIPKRRDARLCLAGFCFFLLPAVLSFPEGAYVAAPRRAIGSSLFAAWAISRGAWVVGGKLVPSWRAGVVGLLVVVTSFMNLDTIVAGNSRKLTTQLWNEDSGSSKVVILQEIERSLAMGPVIYAVRDWDRPIREIAKSFDGAAYYVKDLDQMRATVEEQCFVSATRLCTVLMPWAGRAMGPDVASWVEALSDLIPPSEWMAGEADPAGVPAYRVARVRLVGEE